MLDVAAEIELLFADDAASEDALAYMSHVARRLADRGAATALLMTADGRLHACHPPDRQARQAAGRIAPHVRTQRGGVMESADGARRWIAEPLQMDDAHVYAVLLAADSREIVLTAEERAEWTALAASAWRAQSVAREVRSLRSRCAQLEAELATLRDAHHETVAGLLHEREDHIQAKRRHIVQLEREVQRRSAALHEALKRAEAASRAKSEFLANVSHEIRTPMTAILGYAELLLDPALTDQERADSLTIIRRNGEHLLEIVNDILDLSKVEAGKLQACPASCTLLREIGDVMTLMRVRAQEKSLRFDVRFNGPVPETIHTDPVRLRQILINLLGNAIKFTPSGSVTLTVSVAAERPDGAQGNGGWLRFEVTDTGIGISPEELTRIFKPFGQADSSTTRRFGGSGLGLTISQRLARLLGGDVTVASEPGRGSTFSLTIDVGPLDNVNWIDRPTLAVPTAEPTSIETDADARLDGVRVLLAEDGPDNQRLVGAILRRAGAFVAVAANGREAIDALFSARAANQPFDVVLMDMQMPEVDGYLATATLRQRGIDTPIIALTAHAMPADRDKCLSAGCTEYLTKPVNRRQLLGVVQRVTTARATPHSE